MDEARVAESRIEQTAPVRFSLGETFDLGKDTGTPVVENYAAQMLLRFTGKLDKLTIDLT